MKSLILVISLSLSLICVGICIYMDVRLIPMLTRTAIVFAVSFAGTLLLAVLFFLPHFSSQQKKDNQDV